MKGLGQLMRQAQEMQANMQKVQDELASTEVTGNAGGGMVTVSMTCKHEVRGVEIEPTLLDGDKELLEDLIAAAFNDAAQKAQRLAEEKLGGVAGGLPLPEGFKLPF
jgi:DNA-binding YbaB/EbfC family protein